jgi:hypothetical protein
MPWSSQPFLDSGSPAFVLGKRLLVYSVLPLGQTNLPCFRQPCLSSGNPALVQATLPWFRQPCPGSGIHALLHSTLPCHMQIRATLYWFRQPCFWVRQICLGSVNPALVQSTLSWYSQPCRVSGLPWYLFCDTCFIHTHLTLPRVAKVVLEC